MLTQQLELFAKMQNQLNEIQAQKDKELGSYLERLYKAGMKYVYQGMGLGPYDNQLATALSKFNRFGISHGNQNYLKYGYIFITRPHLNLNPFNLKADRILNLLNVTDPTSIQFAIRIMLDTEYARFEGETYARQCPYVDWRSPFFTWIMNNITDFSGGPQYQLETDQDDGGYFGESQAIALSSNSYSKPFDLSIAVNDPYGGPIEAALFYWLYVMQQQYLGTTVAYPQDINEQVLNYTVSIYRFIMDFTGQYIQRAFKYTGCFPMSRPGASVADFNIEQPFVEQARHFTISFKCGSGHVDERDPIIIKEFNDLCERYYSPFRRFPVGRGLNRNYDGTYDGHTPIPRDFLYKSTKEIDEAVNKIGLIRNLPLPDFNYTGVPYITFTQRGPRLDFFREINEMETEKIIKELNDSSQQIFELNKNYNDQVASILNTYYSDAVSTMNNNISLEYDSEVQFV